MKSRIMSVFNSLLQTFVYLYKCNAGILYKLIKVLLLDFRLLKCIDFIDHLFILREEIEMQKFRKQYISIELVYV
jgi:hypothetical protein